MASHDLTSELQEARSLLRTAIEKDRLAPAFVRLALHDALTFDAATRTGGPNGSIRTAKELGHPGNEDLVDAAVSAIESVKQRTPALSYADLIHLAGALGIEALGGPAIPFTPGRRDSRVYPPPGRLPSFDNCKEEPARLWRSFKRTGLTTREATVLLGVHPFAQSWTDPSSAEQAQQPVRFQNGFFRELLEGSLSSTYSAALLQEPGVQELAEAFRDNPDLFAEDYAAVFQRASELGVAFAGASPTQTASQELYTSTQVVAAVAASAAVVAGLWWWQRRRRAPRL